MVLTKEDLQEWKSHPVTQQIFEEIDKAVIELKLESVVRDTCDQTAMQAARNEGVIEGASLLKEAYEVLEEAAE